MQTCGPILLELILLELILHVAEDHPQLRGDVPRLLRAGLDEAGHNHQYMRQLLHNGLSAEQRAELRVGRWQAAGVEVPAAAPPTLLARTSVPGDPVVASHLPDVLRIHHISDLHHGGNLRANVDAKDVTRAARARSRSRKDAHRRARPRAAWPGSR